MKYPRSAVSFDSQGPRAWTMGHLAHGPALSACEGSSVGQRPAPASARQPRWQLFSYSYPPSVSALLVPDPSFPPHSFIRHAAPQADDASQ